MSNDALKLRHLTLQPTPLDQVPDDDDLEFEHDLVEEARTLLESDLWTEKKDWHGGVVTTYTLPQGNVTYDPQVPGGKAGKAPNAESGGEGILWHKRVSRFKAAEHGDYETWWSAMGADHIEQEKEYVDNLVAVVDIGKEADKKACYCKLYKLPFGATDRSFLSHVVVAASMPSATGTTDDTSAEAGKKDKKDKKSKKDKKGDKDAGDAEEGGGAPGNKADGPREFMVFSLPITTDTPIREEKKYVRGTQATVERIRELDGGGIEWSCASLSTPGGNIPVKLAEGKMAQSLADGVPAVLTWMDKKYPPSASHIKNGTYTADSEATARNPAPVRVTDKSAHPGGSHGLMPPMAARGLWTLEMFQQPVLLRDY
ncbi:hypothetical protein JCM10908_005462 [Rhodotorula pacifica]|uniref:uncharacterized protein n=1 Tax=Rhodotorula pacifica TaxID=1495444 RepID=UPI0031788844